MYDNYDVGTDYGALDAYTDPSAYAAAWGAFAGIFLTVLAVILIFSIIVMWKIFVKAGEPGWTALIPFYRWYKWIKISGRNQWTFWAFVVALASILPVALFLAIPVLGILIYIAYFVFIYYLVYLVYTVNLGLAKNFGKDNIEFMALITFPLTSFIGLIILAFGSAKYLPKRVVSSSEKLAA